MGTRALTVIKNEDDKEIVVMYGQYDGYPQGYGVKLQKFLDGKKIVNGFTYNDELQGNFNGMECLAAQIVSHFKTGTGNFYLYPAGVRNISEEYIYTVTNDKGTPKIKVEEVQYEKK